MQLEYNPKPQLFDLIGETGSIVLKTLLLALFVCIGAVACGGGVEDSIPPTPVSAVSAPSSAGTLCGLGVSDWCPSPPGDACGRHQNQTSCKADASCEGVRYRGPSLVACTYDARGFASNCPSVGCISP